MIYLKITVLNGLTGPPAREIFIELPNLETVPSQEVLLTAARVVQHRLIDAKYYAQPYDAVSDLTGLSPASFTGLSTGSVKPERLLWEHIAHAAGMITQAWKEFRK